MKALLIIFITLSSLCASARDFYSAAMNGHLFYVNASTGRHELKLNMYNIVFANDGYCVAKAENGVEYPCHVVTYNDGTSDLRVSGDTFLSLLGAVSSQDAHLTRTLQIISENRAMDVSLAAFDRGFGPLQRKNPSQFVPVASPSEVVEFLSLISSFNKL